MPEAKPATGPLLRDLLGLPAAPAPITINVAAGATVIIHPQPALSAPSKSTPPPA